MTIIKIEILLDSKNPDDKALLETLLNRAPLAPLDQFIEHIRYQKVGKYSTQLAKQMEPNKHYTPDQMGKMLNMTARRFGIVMTILGRPENKYPGIRIFTRHGECRGRTYSITPEMKKALENL